MKIPKYLRMEPKEIAKEYLLQCGVVLPDEELIELVAGFGPDFKGMKRDFEQFLTNHTIHEDATGQLLAIVSNNMLEHNQ